MARRNRSSSRRGGGSESKAKYVDIGVLWESNSKAEMTGIFNSVPIHPKWTGNIAIFPAGEKAGFDFKLVAIINEEEDEDDTKGSRRGNRSRRNKKDDEEDDDDGDDFDGDQGEPEGENQDPDDETKYCNVCGENVGPDQMYCPARESLQSVKKGTGKDAKPALKCGIGLPLGPEDVPEGDIPFGPEDVPEGDIPF